MRNDVGNTYFKKSMNYINNLDSIELGNEVFGDIESIFKKTDSIVSYLFLMALCYSSANIYCKYGHYFSNSV